MIKQYQLFILLITSLSFSSCKKDGGDQTINIISEQQNLFPEPLGYISDYTYLLTLEESTELEKFIDSFEKRTSNEIAIAIFESIPVDRDFKRYCVELSNNWGVGKAGKDNGIVFIVDLQNKRVAISAGDQISKVLTSEKCSNILSSITFPNFKQQLYYEGLMASLIALVAILDSEDNKVDK